YPTYPSTVASLEPTAQVGTDIEKDECQRDAEERAPARERRRQAPASTAPPLHIRLPRLPEVADRRADAMALPIGYRMNLLKEFASRRLFAASWHSRRRLVGVNCRACWP